MSVYVDASPLVKRYVTEAGSADVVALTNGAAAVATALVTRAEVAAAFARAVTVGVLDDVSGRRAQRRFSREWPDFMRIPVTVCDRNAHRPGRDVGLGTWLAGL